MGSKEEFWCCTNQMLAHLATIVSPFHGLTKTRKYDSRMEYGQSLPLLGFAALFLAASAVFNSFKVWSLIGNYTIGAICGGIALLLAVVGLTAFLCDCSLNQIPRSRANIVTLVFTITLGLGLLADWKTYGPVDDWLSSAGEWVGLSLGLAGMFWFVASVKKPI